MHLAQVGTALSAAAFLYVSGTVLGYVLEPQIYVAAFCGTWAVYLLDARDPESPEDRINQPLRAAWSSRYRRLTPWIVAGSLGVTIVCFAEFLTSAVPLICILILGIVTLAYLFPIVWTPHGWRTIKQIPYIKTLVINGSWLAASYCLPRYIGTKTEVVPLGLVGLTLAIHGSLLVLDTLALNFRDRHGDSQAGLQTLAIRLGPNVASLIKWMAFSLWVITLVIFLNTSMPEKYVKVELTMVTVFLITTLALPKLERKEVAFSIAVGLWRFAGALVLLLMLPCFELTT